MKLYCDSSLTEYCFWFEDADRPFRALHIPQPKTHNIGEYLAVQNALIMAIASGLESLEVFTDSQLVVGQVAQGWKVKEKHFVIYINQIKEMLAQTKSTIAWISREENPAGKELEKKR